MDPWSQYRCKLLAEEKVFVVRYGGARAQRRARELAQAKQARLLASEQQAQDPSLAYARSVLLPPPLTQGQGDDSTGSSGDDKDDELEQPQPL